MMQRRNSVIATHPLQRFHTGLNALGLRKAVSTHDDGTEFRKCDFTFDAETIHKAWITAFCDTQGLQLKIHESSTFIPPRTSAPII